MAIAIPYATSSHVHCRRFGSALYRASYTVRSALLSTATLLVEIHRVAQAASQLGPYLVQIIFDGPY